MRLGKFLHYWPIVPLLIVVLVAREWAETSQPEIVKEDTIDMRETRADYYLEEFTTRRFNANGSLEYRITGRTLAHYPGENVSEITEPKVSLYRPGIEWHMESDRGDFTEDPEVFTLHGNVVVRRSADSESEVLIQTSDLQVLNDANEVQTDQRIDIVAETWHLSAEGLQSAIDEGKLVLQSNVVGHFESPSQPTLDQSLGN
ncbi:MAG: LPS export ABC transporter periplasmic protein LptC [Gammaproteobacteria bacterium]|nr:LPS export ABC transporter periplasmic protein LptC [Gammaproteobacteria bacterium]